jgi:transposase
MEQSAAIKFCVKLKKTATETFEMLKSAYSEEYLSRTGVFEWHKRFKEGGESLQDNEWKGRPSPSRIEESTKVIQKCLPEDQTLSIQMLEEMTGINRETVRKILVEVGPGIFCMTRHLCILRVLSPSFWRNEGCPCYPIHPTPLI